jgi:hypothetical protein
MEKELQCSFYRKSKNIDMGRGLGCCDLNAEQTICNGDLNLCERTRTSSKSQNEQYGDGEDRKKHPRVVLDLPLEYRITNIPNAHGALIVNGNEMGLIIESVEDIPIGTNLNVAVSFPKGYELTNFEVLTQVVWKEIYRKENWEGYQYKLKFVSTRAHDHWKLRQLPCGQFNSDEISYNL